MQKTHVFVPRIALQICSEVDFVSPAKINRPDTEHNPLNSRSSATAPIVQQQDRRKQRQLLQNFPPRERKNVRSENTRLTTATNYLHDDKPSTSKSAEGPVSDSPLKAAVITAVTKSAMHGSVRRELVVLKGNRLESIDVKGDAIFARQAQMIRGAQKEVFIQTFSWDPGSDGAKMILDALLDLANKQGENQEKLKIRLLFNEGMGWAKNFMLRTTDNKNKSGSKQLKRWPSSSSRMVGNYKNDPEHKYANITSKLDFEVRVYQHSSSNSLHSKSVVVDGKMAALTGANVQQRNHGAHPAYDYGITISGPVAQGLRDDFVNHWNSGVNPDQKTFPLTLFPRPLAGNRVSNNAEHSASDSGIEMAILSSKSNWNLLNNKLNSPQDQAFISALRNATSSIQIMTPNLNAPAILKELIKAANHGVKVQILLSKGFNDKRVQNSIAGGTNQSAIQTLLMRTKNQDALEIRYFQNPDHPEGAPIPEGNVSNIGASHAKFMAIDDEMVIVGSANMDKTSLHFSAETNVALFDKNATRSIKAAVFDKAWNRSQQIEEISSRTSRNQ